MTWFKVDDNLAFHPKAVAAGNAAMGLWVRVGSWCAQQLTDGRVPAAMVPVFGGTDEDVKRLVEVRLWHASGDECDVCESQGTLPVAEGYQYHDWLGPGMQPSRADKEAERVSARERQRRKRERDAETGRFASQRESQEVSRRDKADVTPASRRDKAVSHTSPVPSRPDPDKESMAGLVSHLQVVRANGEEVSIDRKSANTISSLCGHAPDEHVIAVSKHYLDRAPGEVRSPGAFVIRSIRNEDDEKVYRWQRPRPRKTEECPHHPGQWPDNCSGCKADRLAGDTE